MRRFSLLLAVVGSCAVTQDRPGGDPPTDWSTKEGATRNILWTASIGRWSFGWPVVSDGLVWIGTDNDRPRDPAVKTDGSVLACFRERDGAFLWQQLYPRRVIRDSWIDIGLPLQCVPLVIGDRLWVVNNRWEVICLDIGPLKRDGSPPIELWKVDLMERTGTWPQTQGMGGGIVLTLCPFGDRTIFVATGNGLDWKTNKPRHPDAPALVCFDRDTGKIVGRERPAILGPERIGNWSSPILGRASDGRTLVLFGGADGFFYAFDPVPSESGTLRQVWKVDCRRPDGEPMAVLARPLVHEGRVYVATGVEADSDGSGNLSCIDIGTGRRIWNNLDVGMTLSSPVLEGNRLFVPFLRGLVKCFDTATGKEIWEVDALSLIVGSPVLDDGRLFVCNGDDELMILDVRSSREKPGVIKQEVIGCAGTTPVVVNGTLYIAGRDRLYTIREGATGATARESPGLKRGRAAGARFVPTPGDTVRHMLNLAAITEKDVVYDLGSGDGRIVVEAATQYKCKAVGVEIDRDLVQVSREAVRSAGLEEKVRIEHEDLLKADFSSATVVTLYIGDRLNRLLLPKLQALQAGTRIVSHQFRLPGMKAAGVWTDRSSEDGRDHELFLYRTPLQPE